MGVTVRRTGALVCVLLLWDLTPLAQTSPVHRPSASEDGPWDQDPLRVPWDDSKSSSPGGSPPRPEHSGILEHSPQRQQTGLWSDKEEEEEEEDLLHSKVSASRGQAAQLPPPRQAADLSASSRISKLRSVHQSVEDVFESLPSYAMFIPADSSRRERERLRQRSVKRDKVRRQYRTLRNMFIALYNRINRQIPALPTTPRSHQRSKRSNRSVEDVLRRLPVNAMFLPRDASEEERNQFLQRLQRSDAIREQFHSLQKMFINMHNTIQTRIGALQATSRSQQRSRRSDGSVEDWITLAPMYAMFRPRDVKLEEKVRDAPKVMKEPPRPLPPSSASPPRVDASQDQRDPSAQKPAREDSVTERVDPVPYSPRDGFQSLPPSITSLPVSSTGPGREPSQRKSATIMEQFHSLKKIYEKICEWIRQRMVLQPATGGRRQIKKRDADKNYVIPNPK